MNHSARGWHRPVRRRHVLTVMLATALIWTALVATAVWHVRQRWQAELDLQHQPLTLSLPTGMPARAEVRTPIYTRLDFLAKVAVPIDQVVGVQLMNQLSAQAVVNTSMPIDTSITFEQDIPVATEVQMKVPLVSWLPAMDVTVPVQFSVPVRMTVPLHFQLPLAMDVHVAGQVSGALKVPLRATMNLSVPVHAKLRADVLNRAEFQLVGLQKPFELRIDQAQVRVPLRDLDWLATRAPTSLKAR
ncbi:MAG: hypothetical protein EOP38_19385 [Rubrivivax sp.]|nr:MAG: hypothetical protein EOP38_19385 [Rubrivivax sp.]